MTLARALAALLAVLLFGGCHRLLPGSVRCPGKGGPEWREYRSAHFVLDTDLDRDDAADLLGDLEEIQALVTVALVGAPREIPGYVRVLVPAREETYRAIASWLTVGYYTSSALGEPMVVMHPTALRRDPQIIAHELAHHFTWYFFPRQPRWFTEGLAQFVQTVASETPGYGRAAGLVPSGAAPYLRELTAIPASRILAWRGGGDRERQSGEYQIWSWVLYHWLWNERPKQLGAFQAGLARAEDPALAWRAAFPGLDPDREETLAPLDAALDEHRRSGELVFYEVSASTDASYSDAALPPSDVHLLLLDARRHWGGSVAWHRRDDPVPDPLARKEVDAALDDDPVNPVARAARARLEGLPLVPVLREAVTARPGDWRAWLLLADALEAGGDAADREGAYRRAVSLNPRSAPAQAGLAWALAASGRIEDALPVARRAVELAPSSPRALATLAKIAADLGSCEDALALASRAADVLGEGKGADEIRGRLREPEERCGRAPRPPSGVSRGEGAAPGG